MLQGNKGISSSIHSFTLHTHLCLFVQSAGLGEPSPLGRRQVSLAARNQHEVRGSETGSETAVEKTERRAYYDVKEGIL